MFFVVSGQHSRWQKKSECEYLPQTVSHGAWGDRSSAAWRPLWEVWSRKAEKLAQATPFTRRGEITNCILSLAQLDSPLDSCMSVIFYTRGGDWSAYERSMCHKSHHSTKIQWGSVSCFRSASVHTNDWHSILSIAQQWKNYICN